MTVKTALVILGAGFEEIEALAPVDLLRRAEVECITASCAADRMVCGRSGIRIEADTLLDEVVGRRFDCLVIPGGPGTKELRQDPRVVDLVRAHYGEDKLIAAICAAPTVLLDAGILPGLQYTAHASVLSELPEILEQAVVVDGRVLTSRGAGTAVEFGLALIAALVGQETANAVADSIHFEPSR